MKLLISRVKYADININNTEKRSIKKGLLVYLGISIEDENIDNSIIEKSINKLLSLKFFEDETKRLKKNIKDVDADILIVSNFSLYARAKKGTSLDFSKTLSQEKAEYIYNKFIIELKSKYNKIVTGEFRTNMEITSEADGPLNVILEF